MNKTLRFLSVPLAVTVIFGILLSSYNVSADDAVDEINITVPVSCSLSGSGMDSHNTEINNGQSNSTIGETTMKVFCNDNNGFAIYAIGYTDNTDGKNVLTSPTLGSEHDIATGTATSGDTSNWAMKLSTITDPAPTYPIIIAGSTADTDREQDDPDFTSFQEVPDDYTLVAKRTSGTDINPSGHSTAEGATLKSTYQAYISKTQPAGTYTGQVKYTLVHPNDGAAPTKPISIEIAMANANKQKLNGYHKMQDLDNTICNTVNIIESDGMTELIDVRDNHVYKVTKLADGNCWMLDNLALDPTDTTTATNMDATNTNASAEAITNYLNGGSTNTGWSRYKVFNMTYMDSDAYQQWFKMPFINNQSQSTLVISYGPASVNNQAKVGIYYNYCAASVGTYCYDIGSDIDLPDTIIDAPQDVCPANWRMPTGGDTGEYTTLYSYYNTTQSASNSASLQYALSTPLSGSYYYWGDPNPSGQNSSGYWWSSTRVGTDGFSTLFVTSGSTDLSRSDSRERLNTMRCLVGG